MSLYEYARGELERAEHVDEQTARTTIDIVERFTTGGVTRERALEVVGILNKLLQTEPLTPLTAHPSEWEQVTEVPPMWRSKRDAKVWSRDGGETWYHTEDPSKNNGDTVDGYRWAETWLGDDRLQLGVTLRVKPGSYDGHSGEMHNGKVGTFVGARNGYVYIKYNDDTVSGIGAPHRAEQVEIAV